MRRTVIGNTLIVVFVLGFTGICVAWNWPKWWVNISLEVCALAWLQSAFLLIIGIVLLQTAAVRKKRDRDSITRRLSILDSQVSDWICGAGFVFLSLDERFQFHERLRDYYNYILKGERIVPWVERGNYALIAYGLAGLFFAFTIIKNDRHLKSIWCFVIGCGTALLAISMDAFTSPALPLAGFRLEQFIEELLEMTTMTLFLLFFLNRWYFYLDGITEKASA
jgi:hypothetical protein